MKLHRDSRLVRPRFAWQIFGLVLVVSVSVACGTIRFVDPQATAQARIEATSEALFEVEETPSPTPSPSPPLPLTPTSQATPAPLDELHVSPSDGFSIAYPFGWEFLASAGGFLPGYSGVAIRHTTGSLVVVATETDMGITLEESAAIAVEDIAVGMGSQDYRELSRVEYGDPPGFLIEAFVTVGGVDVFIKVLMVQRGDRFGAVVTWVRGGLRDLHQPTLDSILQSLDMFEPVPEPTPNRPAPTATQPAAAATPTPISPVPTATQPAAAATPTPISPVPTATRLAAAATPTPTPTPAPPNPTAEPKPTATPTPSAFPTATRVSVSVCPSDSIVAPSTLNPGDDGLAHLLGECAPDFQTILLGNGNQPPRPSLGLRDLAGRPVVVSFWFPSCPPCRFQALEIEAVLRRHSDDDLAFIGIQSRLEVDGVDQSQQFVNEFGITYPVGLDIEGDIVSGYGIIAYPSTIFLDRDHRVVRTWTGPIEARSLEEIIRVVFY